MKKPLSLLKVATKVIIDSSILPGTAMGAEILWLYCMRWKNQYSMYSMALIYFVFSSVSIQIGEGSSSGKSISGQEKIK